MLKRRNITIGFHIKKNKYNLFVNSGILFVYCNIILKTKQLLLTISIFITTQLYAQPKIKMDKIVYEFGTIKETSKAEGLFEIYNTGSDTLAIEDIQAECGCTMPILNQRKIAPGAMATLLVRYDGKDRIGSFNKKIALYTNASPKITVLIIAGTVIPDAEANSLDQYKLAGLHLKMQQLPLGEIYNNQKKTFVLDLINTSDMPIYILGFKDMPRWLNVPIFKDTITIQPKTLGKLIFEANGASIADYGEIKKVFYMKTSDPNQAYKTLFLSAIVNEYFEPEPKRKKKLKKYNQSIPNVTINKKIIDFGKVNGGAVAEDTIFLTNTGFDTLKIRKIFSSCGCLQIRFDKSMLLPNETAAIVFYFDSINRREKQYKNAIIYTNAPRSPEIQISTVAEVIN